MFVYGGGGSFVCCVVYFKNWYFGLIVKVKWIIFSFDLNVEGDVVKEYWYEVVVLIDRYEDEVDILNVYFLFEGKVWFIILNKGLG